MDDLSTERGFEAMYREYFPKIYNYVFYRLLSREETEDIVSNIFLKVLANASKYDAKKASFRTWIYTIARNAVTDHFRVRRVNTSLDDDGVNVSDQLTVDFDEQLSKISTENRRAVYAELSRLPERDRVILYYKFFEGYSNREIAAMLSMNENTVASVVFRSLRKLRETPLKDLEFDEN